jgi:2-phosphosulfolactate phosphatase
VVPVASIEEAASEPADLRIGERGSAKVAGFDFGNPPTEILASNLRTCPLAPGLPSLRRTAPGSLRQAPTDAPAVYAAAFVNVGARAGKLATFQDVTVVGCGREAGRASSENEDAVGAILRRLEGRGAALDAWAWRRRRGLPPAPPEGAARQQRGEASQASRARDRPGILPLGRRRVGRAARLAGGAFVGARDGAESLAPGPNKKAKFILDTEVERLYSAVSQGGSNVTR